MFSHRFSWELETNALSRLLDAMRAKGDAIIDLTQSNPTQVGLVYPAQELLEALSQPACLTYAPDPRGLDSARAAVADYYQDQGARLDPQHLFLTASTSEAYSMLFKLLADPGQELLVPRPGYPLLSYLAGFDNLKTATYPMQYEDQSGWTIDPELVRALVTPRTRAIVVVNPNNPTGSYIHPKELAALDQICCEYDLALIVDEVFNDFYLGQDPLAPRTVLGRTRALTFVLNGFSKMMALPQVKLAWIALGGEKQGVEAASRRLEIVLDFFLSVSAPIQHAAAQLMAQRIPIQTQIRERLNANLHILSEMTQTIPHVRRLRCEGGWYGLLDFTDPLSDEQRVLKLLQEAHTLAHPGFFYDFHREGFVVLSLLCATDLFEKGVRRLIDCFDR